MWYVRAAVSRSGPQVTQVRSNYTRIYQIVSTPARTKVSGLEKGAHAVVMFFAVLAYPSYILRTLKTG